MSDTTTCPNCSATLPSGAAFCTTCGTRLAPAEAPAPEAPAADATRVDNPGLHDATQVFAPPPAPPAAPAAAWQPAEAATPPPLPGPPPAQPGWGAPPASPPPPPAAPAAWPPAASTAPPPTTWGAPGAAPASPATWNQAPAGAWGAPAPAPAAAAGGGGSPLGGLVALVGGLLVLVGLFTAWLGNNVTDDTLSGWELLDGDNGFETSDPYLLLALGIVALALGVALFRGVARTPVRIVAVLVGVGVVVTHARDWMDIADIAKALPQGVEITAQFGFYLGIVGGILVALAALLPAKK